MTAIQTAQDLSNFVDATRFQARICEGFGSPFSGVILDIVADDIEAGGPFAHVAAPWAWVEKRRIDADAAPLRLLGGLHYLALDGSTPELSALYPPAARVADRGRLAPVITETVSARLAFFDRFVTSPPQTNEVSRSKALIGGFLTVAAQSGLPLRCLEIGSSAGLNQNWSRYRYAFDGWSWGDTASPVTFVSGWSGGAPPLDARVEVAERIGCDQNPIDVGDPEQALRLRAYVWPDQAERVANLQAAIGVAQGARPAVERQDAAVWARVNAVPKAGAATVLFHSIVWQYLPANVRDSLRATIAAAGEAARPDRPFAWLRMEPSVTYPAGMNEVKLTVWPGGAERLLALAHPHGATVEWLG